MRDYRLDPKHPPQFPHAHSRATRKQIEYCNILLEKHDAAGTLEDVIEDLKPDLGENQPFEQWFAHQSIARASEIIQHLKDNL